MTVGKPRIQVSAKELKAFCKQYHIQKLAFFGSVLRDDFRSDSDIDILVEFEPDHIPGFEFFSIQDELSRILNRNVDLNTLGFLSPRIRDDVLREAKVIYVKT